MKALFVGWLVGCLTSQQHTSVSQGRICSDNVTCCHTEIEVADQTFHLTQSQYTDTGPTSPSTDPITRQAPGRVALECQFLSHWYDSTPEKSRRKRDSNPGSSALGADALTTRPTRWSRTEARTGTAARESSDGRYNDLCQGCESNHWTVGTHRTIHFWELSHQTVGTSQDSRRLGIESSDGR